VDNLTFLILFNKKIQKTVSIRNYRVKDKFSFMYLKIHFFIQTNVEIRTLNDR